MKSCPLPVMTLTLISLLPRATGQANADDLKHLIATPLGGETSVSLTARSIERGVDYPAIIQLKGGVEIRVPVCFRTGPQQPLRCEGETVIRADAAEFHEETGEIEAHGTVHVTPLSRNK